MSYEVELKFKLDDDRRILEKLNHLTADRGSPIEQRDRYFNHPSRDFAHTDEALRIRSANGRCWVTYKGPLLDEHTKTRREIEVPLGDQQSNGDRFAQLLEQLGFREVRTVVKRRTPFRLVWEDRQLELAFDQVEGLGKFLEIETITDEPDREAAQDSILRLADRLDLHNSLRTSYLTLLLEQDAG